MAEALGLASSVIAVVDLTAKVAVASIKLVNLWKEIKNVPDELLQKAERLRDFEDFLQETESQAASSPLPQRAWNSALLQKYISRTRAVLKDLQEMVDQLYTQVTDSRKFKRKLASTKAVLRKEDLSALDSKLSYALELFKLAREQYLTSLMSYSLMVQLQQSSDIKSIQTSHGQVASRGQTEDTSVDCGTNTSQSLVVRAPAIASFSHRRTMIGRIGLSWKSDVGYKLHAQPPSWLTGSVYSVLAQKSLWGWQLSLKSYEVMEHLGDGLFMDIWNDDCPALFKRLHDQTMSPFVRVRNGSTLLELAFEWSSLSIVKKLLECGLGSCVLENSSKTNRSYPWVIDSLASFWIHEKASREKIHTALVELSKYGLDDFLEGTEVFDIYLETFPAIAGFRVLLEYAGRRRYQSFPFRKRLQHFRKITWMARDNQLSLDELHLLLPETKNLTIDDLMSSRSTGCCSLFHSLAHYLARQTARSYEIDREPMSQIQWGELLRTCLQLDPAGLHHLEEVEISYYAPARFQTPFSFLLLNVPRSLLNFASSGRWPSGYQCIQRVMSAWLDVLTLNGTDLLEYGRKERRLHKKGLIFRHTYYGLSHLSHRLRLLGITYGKSKDDWRCWWVVEYEHYVGDFWEMVHQVDLDVKIPGSWVDECDYDHYSPYREERPTGERFFEEHMPLIWSEHREVKAPL